MKNGRRHSIESMYEYDMPETRQSSYHSIYLKMVGATIFLTFIGIVVFLQIEKAEFEKPIFGKHAAQTEITKTIGQADYAGSNFSPDRHKSATKKSTHLSQKQAFQEQQWKSVGNSITSKQIELRHHFRQILILISELQMNRN